MHNNIKPGTLVHIGYVGHEKIGMFLSYDPYVNIPTRPLKTCNVLIDEEVAKVWIGLVKPIEEEK